jgi:hypothetical protein
LKKEPKNSYSFGAPQVQASARPVMQASEQKFFASCRQKELLSS